MTQQRVGLRVPSAGPLRGLARRGVRVEGNPLGRQLVLRCTGPPGAIAQLAADAGPAHALRDAEGALALVVDAPDEVGALFEALREGGAILLPPLVWHDDVLEVDAVTSDPQRLVDLLPGAELASKVRIGEEALASEVAARSLHPGVTRRQAEALLAALDAGYYDSPRRATAGEVAKNMGIGRSTFEEHLRLAESAAVRAIAPLMRLRAANDAGGRESASAEAVQLYARFSSELGLHVEMAVRGEAVRGVRLVREPSPGATDAEHPYLARLMEHLAHGGGDVASIPLDLSVSAFERRVLDALREVPFGATVTYGEIARRVGSPGASRAVGNACANNPVLVLVPCHRVLPASGKIGNYAGEGGARTKELLLRLEGAKV